MQVETYFKEKTVRDPAYLRFIESMPCMITGRQAEAHHEPLNGHGMGIKGPDNETLPLSREMHTKRHAYGRESFWEQYDIDWRYEVELYQKLYAADRAAKGE